MKPDPHFPPVDTTLLRSLGIEGDPNSAQAALYARYVRALALLAECAPYVDVQDYVELIDEVLEDAQACYPLDVRRDGDRREIAPRVAAEVAKPDLRLARG